MIDISTIRKFNKNYEKMIQITDDFTEAENGIVSKYPD